MTMEDKITRQHSCNPTSPASKLAMHRDSHVISKFKPKVRIIHIFAPEIIKTDVANFRELVQRLTGKPGDDGISTQGRNSRSWKKKTRRMKEKDGQLPSLIQREKLQEKENEIWGSGENNSSDFLDGFGDVSGFIHDLSNNFSLPPQQSSHHLDMFGDMQLA
ncbi:VQ motif-containing protein 25-like [Hevea brasiliensis]|nr:VQ motif-containing protein 25-like [Hevea brasiliensis]